MKNNAIKWLYTVTGKKKWNILWLMLVQALNGASGVVYALLLRNIVDNAVDGDRSGFKKEISKNFPQNFTVCLPMFRRVTSS